MQVPIFEIVFLFYDDKEWKTMVLSQLKQKHQ